jgi:pyridoxine kinase
MTPNLTEACFLTQFPYQNTKEMSEADARAYANELMDRLEELYHCRIAITGIRLCDGSVANLCKDEKNERFFSQQPECGHSYPGTGDIFASVLLGKLLGGESFPKAVDAAADFVARLIRVTISLPTETREGVALEPELWRLIPRNRD